MHSSNRVSRVGIALRSARISRRGFLGGIAAAAATAIVPRHVLGGAGHVPPSEKTTLAGIGVGGQGIQNMIRFQQFPEIQVVAVCDVNRQSGGYLSWNWSQGKETRLAGRAPARRVIDEAYAKQKNIGKYRGCQAYADYRELLEKEDVDAVMVATPDHSHAMITLAAIERGKHVYCEKPLTYSVYEARQVAEAARRAKVATQLGNQGQASEEDRLVREFILDGALGPVHEVKILWGGAFWAGPEWDGRPPETPPVPEGLDWDLWLGPAPARPYHAAYHPWRWRDWWDFGTGQIGDMGCHKLSTVFKRQAGPPDKRRSQVRRSERGNLPPPVRTPLRIPGPRWDAPGQAELVQRSAAPAAEASRGGPPDGRRSLHRRDRDPDGTPHRPGIADAGVRAASQGPATLGRP